MHYHYELVLKFMKHIAWNLVLAGILSIVAGVLIFIYPKLLAILVSALLIVIGLLCLALAIRVKRYSKLVIDV